MQCDTSREMYQRGFGIGGEINLERVTTISLECGSEMHAAAKEQGVRATDLVLLLDSRLEAKLGALELEQRLLDANRREENLRMPSAVSLTRGGQVGEGEGGGGRGVHARDC